MKYARLLKATSALVGVSILLSPVTAFADDDDASTEEIVVTGSFVRRPSQSDLASPITSIGQSDINAIGANSIADITQTLTINTGSQNNPDAFTQNATTGTTNINLRGLGVASTLVLLNGRRQVVTAVTTNDGISFIDTASIVPEIAIERQDILKDGAAALYGSDAVAGVVNFITRDNFEGFEVQGDSRFVVDFGNSSEFKLSGIVGIQGDRGGIVAAAAYTDRSPLTTLERRLSEPEDDTSALGQPGAFFLTAPIAAIDPATGAPIVGPDGSFVPAIPAGTPLIDPSCAAVGGIPLAASPTAPPPASGIGFCGFDFGDFFNLIPEETRLQGFAKAHYDITDRIEFKAEFGFSRNRNERNNSPTFPFLQLASATVPAINPGFETGFPLLGGANLGQVPVILTDPATGEESISIGQPALTFFGRAIGIGGEPAPNFFASDTFRVSTSLTGEIGESWYWDVAYTRAINDFMVTTPDVLTSRFQAALNGFGGPDCVIPPPGAQPGVGPCEFFNPFGLALENNSEAIFTDIIGTQTLDADSDLTVVDALISGDTFDPFGAGNIGVALGFQFRSERLAQDFDSNSNLDLFAFIIGNDDFDDDRRIFAGFGELVIPVLENLEINFALRYETTEDIGDTLDPKVAVLYRPTEWISLRGSYSTGFRAPSIFQTAGTQTTLSQIEDPIAGTAFVAVRSVGDPDIDPETSRAFNVGVTLEPIENLVFNVDYYNFEFEDVIIQESAQALVIADPFDPAITRGPGPDGPGTGPIVTIETAFVNASFVETSGIDGSVSYLYDTRFGSFIPTFEGTFVINYDIFDPSLGVEIDGEGNRNFTNFGAPTPRFRFNAGLNWGLGAHSANVFVRRISGFTDDQNGGVPVDADTRIDIQYNFDLGSLIDLGDNRNAVFSLGAINATGEEPPVVATNGGFESRVHDPRGRLLYARFTLGF
ncbi:MAG: TonB-dependent receptor [Pseudomonadota bacterium]